MNNTDRPETIHLEETKNSGQYISLLIEANISKTPVFLYIYTTFSDFFFTALGSDLSVKSC